MIAENVESLLRKVDSYSATIVAVTKTQSVDSIRQAIACGLLDMGENRVQEAAGKIVELSDQPIQWHLVGHLQTNKVKTAVSLFSLIQSIDSLRLVEEVNRFARHAGKVQNVLIQVNIAEEASKFGISPRYIDEFVETIEKLANIRLCGLMTIAPFFEEPELTRPIFRQTRQWFERLQNRVKERQSFQILSMGMTHDYQVALEEGSTMVRVGTGIFGTRN